MNITTTLLWLGVTVGAYRLSLEARKHAPSPLTTPVLFSTLTVVATLLATHTGLDRYEPAKEFIVPFLGPATVALAIPLFKNRDRLGTNALPALAGFAVGALSTMVVAVIVARLLGFAPVLVSSIALKSTTVPIAVEIAKIVHGDPALTAIFVVCTGMVGAALGPLLLDRLQVTDPVARGVAFGTIAHGQGTAQAASESDVSGAIAGVAMGFAGIATALAAPGLLPLFLR